MTRVAAYCRVSTDSDDQIHSFESQRQFFNEYIQNNSKWKMFKIYADATVIIGLKQNPTHGRSFSPIFFA